MWVLISCLQKLSAFEEWWQNLQVYLIPLTLALLSKLLSPFLIVSQSDYLIQIVVINLHTEWQTVQIQIGFFRRQLIWIYTVCKGRVYLCSAGKRLTHLNSDCLDQPVHLHRYIMVFVFCQQGLNHLVLFQATLDLIRQRSWSVSVDALANPSSHSKGISTFRGIQTNIFDLFSLWKHTCMLCVLISSISVKLF